MAADRHAEALHLARDLDALTGARLLMETVADPEFTAVMLRLVVRHGEFAAQRARLLLATMDAPSDGPGAGGGS